MVDVEISASNVNGEGGRSDVRSYYVATAPAQMAAPTETKITLPDYAKDEAAVQVSWVAPSNNGAVITGYKLYMAEGPREYNLIYDGTNRADLLSFTATKGIKKSLWYKFKVTAINIIGESQLSPDMTSFVAVVPSTPDEFAFVSSDAGSIEFKWQAPKYDGGATLTGYYIYYKKTLSGLNTAFTKGDFIPASLLTYILTGLDADVEYVVYLRAANVKGESVRTGVIYQYAGAVPSGLSAPVLDVSSRTDKSVSVTWITPTTSTTTVLGYQVLINEPNSNSVPHIVAYDGTGISTVLIATIRGLVSQSGYYVAVRV